MEDSPRCFQNVKAVRPSRWRPLAAEGAECQPLREKIQVKSIGCSNGCASRLGGDRPVRDLQLPPHPPLHSASFPRPAPATLQGLRCGPARAGCGAASKASRALQRRPPASRPARRLALRKQTRVTYVRLEKFGRGGAAMLCYAVLRCCRPGPGGWGSAGQSRAVRFAKEEATGYECGVYRQRCPWSGVCVYWKWPDDDRKV